MILLCCYSNIPTTNKNQRDAGFNMIDLIKASKLKQHSTNAFLNFPRAWQPMQQSLHKDKTIQSQNWTEL